jgi:hypothetical protein
MSGRWPFTVHRDSKFDKLIGQLNQLKIVSFHREGGAIRLTIEEPTIFLEILRTIFILYATPNENSILFSQERKRLIAKTGRYLNLALTDEVSEKARTILNLLITDEADVVYEYSFNALIAVYLGSIKPLDFIYPNTYITELGRDTHEFDVILGSPDKKCAIVETTRGFDKKVDEIDETYTWHFKKALFRKWMLEKLYGVECKLCYITLKNLVRLEADITIDTDETLSSGIQIIDESYNPLIAKVLEHEQDRVEILELEDSFKNALTIQEIDKVLQEKLIEKLGNAL